MRLLTVALLGLLPAMAAVNDIDTNKTAGNPSAPVTVEVYSDFQCPGCKAMHDNTLPELQRDFVSTGKVYLIYRECPLPIHAHSHEAAGYAVAAARLSLYRPVADALFRDQAVWSANGKVWETVASVLTLSQQTKVKALAGNASVLDEVKREVALALAVPIKSTPTLVVERGSARFPVSGTLRYSLLKSLIDGLLR